MNKSELVQLFRDHNFEQGFGLKSVVEGASPVVVGVLDCGKKDVNSRWRIAQWWSRFSLEGVEPVFLPSGGVEYSNEGKTFRWEPDQDGVNVLTLYVKGYNEYEGKIRPDGAGWPHLLIEQHFDQTLYIHKLKSLFVHYEVLITECINYISKEEYDPQKHCAHVVSFFAIGNRNRDKKSYGQYFWFGMPIFDSRYDIPPAYQAKDAPSDPDAEKKGTGMFIYEVDGRELWDRNINDGKWHMMEKNMLPYILEGFYVAREHGYLEDADLEDMALNSFNMGWEVTGPYDAGVKLKNISAEYA